MYNFTPRLILEPLPELEEILVYLTDSTEYSLVCQKSSLIALLISFLVLQGRMKRLGCYRCWQGKALMSWLPATRASHQAEVQAESLQTGWEQ